MSTFITNHPIHFPCQGHTKLINLAYNIRDFMHIRILHTLNIANQPNIQVIPIMWENSEICVRSRLS